MRKPRPTPTAIVLAAGLLALAGAAQAQDGCPLPEGVDPPADPQVTAQQVEDGSADLMDFALAARDRFKLGSQVGGAAAYHFGCLLRQEGGPWRSGSTYLVQLTPDGRVFVHAKDMALSGRLLDRRILAGILLSLGVPRGDLTDPDAVLNTLLEEPHASLDEVSGASGYASAYVPARRPDPLILLAGFDLDASHVIVEEIDYGDPAVTAREVVDRESLKAFVAEAGRYFGGLNRTGGRAAISQAKVAMRDPNGPWRHGSVYLYVLDLASNIILFHGVFPDRFELRPLVATVRDVVTGELILPQVIEAAKSSPDGGFVEYYFDDPTDDTDSADIPKVGYARQFSIEAFNVIIGSGFYGTAASTDIRDEAGGAVAGSAALAPAVPNPFNSSTRIGYRLAAPGPVRLVIHNVLGQPVRTLVDRFQGAGSHRARWDARDEQGAPLSSGVYIARLTHSGGVETRRLLYLE